jgi:ribosomal-protein-alanine N-acetyltransferase
MIQTNRLTLRKYVPDDWERVHLYASVPEFSQFDVWGPNTADDTKSYIHECITRTSAQPTLRYELAVVLTDENVLIGGCGLKRLDVDATEASLGYAINPDYQENGYATEAAVALIEFAFSELQLDRVYAKCDTRNNASRRVMRKAGMRESSVLRNDRQVNGVTTDSYEYVVDRHSDSS